MKVSSSMSRMELSIATGQGTGWFRRRQRRIRTHHLVTEGGDSDGETVMTDAGLSIVTVPDFEIQILLPRVLHAEPSSPVRRAVAAVGIGGELGEGDRRGMQIERMAVDFHLGPVIDPLQRALVRQARAVRVGLARGNHVSAKRFVFVARRRILVGSAGGIIDAPATRDFERRTYKLVVMEK